MRKILGLTVVLLLLVPAAALARPYEGADDELAAGVTPAVTASDEGAAVSDDGAIDLGRFDDGAGGAEMQFDRRDIL